MTCKCCGKETNELMTLGIFTGQSMADINTYGGDKEFHIDNTCGACVTKIIELVKNHIKENTV